ncbi:MAG TPA: hypothetical protein VGK73_19650 [Polyangiaceae bacterium]
MPLKRLRLYESGVGYFERSGAVGADAVTLPVPASHLDDALKTLVVFSGDGPSQVGGIEFGSSVSRGMARALAGLGPAPERLGLVALLTSLKGAGVEVRAAGEAVSGRLVEVLDAESSDLEECVRKPGADAREPCTREKQPALLLMTRAGELRRIRLGDVVSARPTDPAFASRLGAALDALSEGSARLLKEVRVLARAGKTLSLGYVSETPVWRASYRLVLGAKPGDPSALQGWALVHNDTDEPWQKVSIELVNGRPDSFLFPLAAPRYARRELVTPENPLSTVPQLMRTTPDALWNTDAEDAYGYGLGLSGVGEGGGGRGEGIGLGSIGTLGHGSGAAGDSASSLLSVGNLAGVAATEGVESGALFRYALGQTLDLRAHGSALVPFLGEGVSARRIALFDSADGSARSGVFLVHGGSQTLPEGTLAVFGDGGFAGETALPRLKPKESTTVEFGADLDVTDETFAVERNDEPKLLSYSKDGLEEHYVRRHVIPHRFENRSGTGRDVFLRLDFVNNADVKGADEIVYDARKGRPYAVFRLEARSNAERTLQVDEGLSRRHRLAELTRTKLGKLAEASSLPEAQRKILRETIAVLRDADGKLAALAVQRVELAEREAEVARFREHARALGSAGESIAERLLASEDQAERLRRSVRRLKAEAAELSRRAAKTLARLGA